MNNLFKYLLTGLLLVVFMPACTDLDEELFSEIRNDDFFKNQEELDAAVGVAYTNYNEFVGETWALSEVASDEIVVPTRGNDWFDNGNWQRIHLHQSESGDDRVQGAWRELFKGVSTCNRLIDEFTNLIAEDRVTSEDGNLLISELKVLRALFYFFLCDLYGNVPIVESFLDVPANFAPAKNDRAEVYDFIERSVLENRDALTKQNGGAAYGRMNYWGATALLAKLYINAEIYKGTAEWEKARDATKEIVDSGLFELESDYFSNFAIVNENSTENIYVIVYDKVFSGGFNIQQRTLHYESQKTYNFQEQPWNGFCSLSEFYNSFTDPSINPGPQDENGLVLDDRANSFILGPQFDSDGAALRDGGVEDSDPDGAELNFTLDINELGPNALRQAGARIGKYEFENNGTRDMSNDFPVFRYADMLLLHAEALWRINNADADALKIVNDIRRRSGVSDFTSLTAENLLQERGREMCFEYYRRQDLIRFGRYNDAWQFKPADPSDHVNIFPIPKEQLEANANLKQNPGYN